MTIIAVIIVMFICVCVSPAYAESSLPLIKSNNFVYLGAFRMPDTSDFHVSGSSIAYNPTNNSLFIIGHRESQLVGEISIPTLVNSSAISELNVSNIVQGFSDITEGSLTHIADGGGADLNGVYMGGLLVHDNKLIGSAFDVFDANNTAKLSHFTSGLSLSTANDFDGMYQVGTLNPGFVAGGMANVPTDLQSALGGPALTGQGGLSIVSRTSAGPAAFAFDPAQLGITSPVPVTPLLYYPIGHETVGSYGSQSGTGYHQGVNFGGMTVVAGSRTVLFFSSQGIGESVYGGGSSNPIFADECSAPDICDTTSRPGHSVCIDYALGGTCTTGQKYWPHAPLCGSGAGLGCVYDPISGAEGAHAYPYIQQIWAYDANDMEAAKTGSYIVTPTDFNTCRFQTDATTTPPTCLATGQTVQPWNVVPYDKFPIPVFGDHGAPGHSATATYDSVHNILYVAEPGGNQLNPYISSPVIHAFSFNMSATPASTYKVGGQVILLNGTLKIKNNGGDELTVSSYNRTTVQQVSFATGITPGGTYNVSISSQPTGQTCTIYSASGTVSANVDVNNIVVACAGNGSSSIPGICGTFNGLALSTVPTVGLCTAGTPSAVTGTGPWSWSCAGSGGGTTANCGATLANQARSISVKLGSGGKMTGILR